MVTMATVGVRTSTEGELLVSVMWKFLYWSISTISSLIIEKLAQNGGDCGRGRANLFGTCGENASANSSSAEGGRETNKGVAG